MKHSSNSMQLGHAMLALLKASHATNKDKVMKHYCDDGIVNTEVLTDRCENYEA